MTVWLTAIPTLFRVSFADLVAYRAQLVIWILTAMMPLIMLAMWTAVVADGAVAGFGEAEIARYFVGALVVRQLTGAWVFWELNYEIRTGLLSPKLLRPVHPLYVTGIWTLSAIPIRLLVLLPIIGAVILLRPDLLVPPDPLSLALFFVSVFFAWLLSFLTQALLGMAAFWLEQSMGLFAVYFSVFSVLSGYVAPLAMFPEVFHTMLRLLPFRGMLATPVELLGGFLTGTDALIDVGLQAGWTLVFLGLTAWVWHRGIRRYGAFGA